MTRTEVLSAVGLILDGKGKPVTLYVRRLPGRNTAEVTNLLPTGRFHYAYSMAGSYTRAITIAELRKDLIYAESELSKKMAPGKWQMRVEIAA